MSDPVLTVEAPSDDVLIVRLNRPHKRNALSSELKRELAVTARTLEERTDIGAVILAGAGGAFCAGNDLSEPDSFAQDMPLAEARRHIRLGLEMCRAWESLPQLTIAAVDRFAIGGGGSRSHSPATFESSGPTRGCEHLRSISGSPIHGERYRAWHA